MVFGLRRRGAKILGGEVGSAGAEGLVGRLAAEAQFPPLTITGGVTGSPRAILICLAI